jgi:LysM repeat protein
LSKPNSLAALLKKATYEGYLYSGVSVTRCEQRLSQPARHGRCLLISRMSADRRASTKENSVSILDKFRKHDEDKPKADFSNVQSGSSTTAAEPAAPLPPLSEIPTPTGTTGLSQTYEVVAGDSLSKIAKRHYGDANKWHRIYEANRDQIKNPDLIYPGQKLTIPGA